MQTIEELLNLLKLEQIEENIFRGQNYLAPWGRVFGGQVLAQALHAAQQTVPEDRRLHSLHAYFILAGDINQPIIYDVERIRDGGSFTTRRIVAIQKGRPIFNMSASFHKELDAFSHQFEMPQVTPPENLKNDKELFEEVKDKLPAMVKMLQSGRPIEFRPVEPTDLVNPQKSEPIRHVWFKAKGTLPDDLTAHQQVLTYTSDYSLLGTATLPHREQFKVGDLYMASLDHAMWFHRDFRIDEWLLYALDSPSASNSRGFARGNIFNHKGELVASTVQEGLMALRKE